MLKSKKAFTHIALIILLLTSVSFPFCYTYLFNVIQDKPDKDYNFRIEFVRSISSSDDLLKEKGIGEQVIEWIFGSNVINLIRPVSVFNSSRNDFLIVDQGRRQIIKVDTTAEEFIIISDEDEIYFPSLLDICNVTNSTFLFTDSKTNAIYVLDSDNGEVKLLNDKLELNQPTGIAFNQKTGEVWVVETKNHAIAVIDIFGNLIRNIGKRGTAPGEFNFPTFIWIDADGIVYVVDSMNYRIQILSSEGKVLNIFGEVGDATGYFSRPKGVAVDKYGHIYIVDALYNSIQVFNREGEFLYYFGAKGTDQGEFWLPAGICIDENNFIYVADSYNSRIQIFKLVAND